MEALLLIKFSDTYQLHYNEMLEDDIIKQEFVYLLLIYDYVIARYWLPLLAPL
jgi:hypothetical protein